MKQLHVIQEETGGIPEDPYLYDNEKDAFDHFKRATLSQGTFSNFVKKHEVDQEDVDEFCDAYHEYIHDDGNEDKETVRWWLSDVIKNKDKMNYTKTKVCLDENNSFEAYISDEKWNGFEKPYFTDRGIMEYFLTFQDDENMKMFMNSNKEFEIKFLGDPDAPNAIISRQSVEGIPEPVWTGLNNIGFVFMKNDEPQIIPFITNTGRKLLAEPFEYNNMAGQYEPTADGELINIYDWNKRPLTVLYRPDGVSLEDAIKEFKLNF